MAENQSDGPRPQSRRSVILGTFAFLVVAALTVADFLDNGVINNGKFLILALFIFSGAGTGRLLELLIERYIGGGPPPHRRRDDAES